MTVDMARRFKVDFAVIGTSAIDSDGDLLDFDAGEVRVSQTILGQARTRILVADTTKFSRNAPVRIGSLGDLDYFVTDAAPSEKVLNACLDWNTKVVRAYPLKPNATTNFSELS
jgi:DeoR family glycerol-3-phosphate regulon repressor